MSDLIDRDEAIKAVKTGALSAATLFGRTDEGSTALYETVRAIKAIPSAQPECTRECMPMYADVSDNISRQAAIEALGDMVMNWTDSDYELGQLNQWKEDRKAIIDLPSAQPQPCKDAVSKADVLETYAELYDVFDDNKEIKNELHKIYDKINALQAAQPEQPTGVQDILQYLDEYLHPIVSPEHWSVYSELYDMVSMLPSTQQWIPVSERLPEYGTEVVTINKDDEYEINHVIDEEDEEWFFDGAVAWMPLPEPWKDMRGDEDAAD